MPDPNINKKISELPDAASLSDTDELVLARSNANYKVTGAQIKAAVPVNITISQTVLAGAVNASGYANFLSAGTGLAVNLAATSVPVIVAFAYGYDTQGEVNYVGRITANVLSAWSSLPASSTSYLYIDRDISTGALTYGYSATAPQYLYVAPASPSAGNHYYNFTTRKMYAYSGSAWEEKQRTFVGQAVTDGSGVTSVITYALRGEYDSGWFAITHNTEYAKSHNIGTEPIDICIYGAMDSTGAHRGLIGEYGNAYNTAFGEYAGVGYGEITATGISAYTTDILTVYTMWGNSGSGYKPTHARFFIRRGW